MCLRVCMSGRRALTWPKEAGEGAELAAPRPEALLQACRSRGAGGGWGVQGVLSPEGDRSQPIRPLLL